MPESKSVGIWLRVSTDDQAKGDSPQHHEGRARAHAEQHGFRVATIYHLEAVSGKTVREHPECQRMLADVATGRVQGVIFSKVARLARNTRELLELADHFQKYSARLISLEESIDPTTPSGRLLYTTHASLAQWEREEIAARVAASIPIRAKLGKPLGGRAPFGYRYVSKKLVIDPVEAPVRKLMYDLFLQHRRKKTVARLLNERGYRTRKGQPWSDCTVGRLIADPTAKGKRRANYCRQTANGYELKPQSDWVWTDVEPIVTPGLWEQCNTILEERRAGRKRPARKPTRLFMGLAYCHCGSKMYVPGNTPKYVCFSCRNKIPLADLEGVFREQLKGLFLSPDELRPYLDEANSELREKQVLIRSHEAELARIEADMEKLFQLYLSGNLGQDAFGERFKPLETRQKALREELPRLKGEADAQRFSLDNADDLIRRAQDLYSHWDDFGPDDKRRIAEEVTDRITVGAGEIEISLRFQPASAETMTDWQQNSPDPPRPSDATPS